MERKFISPEQDRRESPAARLERSIYEVKFASVVPGISHQLRNGFVATRVRRVIFHAREVISSPIGEKPSVEAAVSYLRTELPDFVREFAGELLEAGRVIKEKEAKMHK